MSFSDAASFGDTIRTAFEAGDYDVCTMIYNKFVNAINQKSLNTAYSREISAVDDRCERQMITGRR